MSAEGTVFEGVHVLGASRSKGNLTVEGGVLQWKGAYTSKTLSISLRDVHDFQWAPAGDNMFTLTAIMRNGVHHRLTGFTSAHIEDMKSIAENSLGSTLHELPSACSNGWNWGSVKTNDDVVMSFDGEGDHPLFNVSYSDISQALLHGTSEVGIEFAEDDTARDREVDELIEMRFYVPSGFEMEEDEGAGEEEEALESAAKLHARIVRRAGLNDAGDDSIASFDQIHLITPRGRYDLEIFPSYFKLHGKSFSYKVLYKSVNRLFLLDKPDNDTTVIVSLDPAIRQGATFYPYLQINFKDDDEIELIPNIPKEVLETKFEGKLEETMSGPYAEVFLRLFHALTGKRVVASGSFSSAHDEKCVRCAHKTQDGLMFPLEKSLFFIHRPPMHIRHSEITSVEFLRIDNSTTGSAVRTFDVMINTATGPVGFTGFNKEEHIKLVRYFKKHRVTLINSGDDDIPEERAAVAPTEEVLTRSGRRVKVVAEVQQCKTS